jgi:DNA-binding response OmpR family regulator
MKNILIVDNDLGFVFWLGAVLIAADYQPWPACSPSDAITLLSRRPLVRLDLLIVNASLPGASKLITHFRRTQVQLKVMALGPQDKTLPGVNAWRQKPSRTDDSAKQEWVRAIKHMFGRWYRAA